MKLKWLKAECHRHLDLPVSADDLYKECADAALVDGPVRNEDIDRIRILLEAATVAKMRGQTEPQIRRAISYLEAIQHTDFAPLRVLGTLTEMYAILGDRTGYEKYLRRANGYIEAHTTINDSHLDRSTCPRARFRAAITVVPEVIIKRLRPLLSKCEKDGLVENQFFDVCHWKVV